MLGLRRKLALPQSNYLRIIHPLDLLSRRSKQIKAIRQLVGIPKSHWKTLYFDALLAFSGYVQQLPASEAHHHCGTGGLLNHSLEVVIHALQIRRGHLLPQRAVAEEITAKKDLWTYAIFSAALLHDVGKPLMDQIITLYDKNGIELGTWDALTAPMPSNCWYRIRYRKDRQHKLHERAALLISRLILPTPALAWLAHDRSLLSAWMAAVSGEYEDAGVIGEIIQQADRQSVAESLGASGATAQLPGARLPLHERLLTGLRYLLNENQIPLNRNGAGAWYDGEQLWLVSKRGIDALRDHLIQEGHTGIPTRNDRIFDELQQNKILKANGDRAIWKITVSAENWSHTLTCLCFPAPRIWPDSARRPDIFSGSITIADVEPTNESNTVKKAEENETVASTPLANQISNETLSRSTSGFDPIEFFSAPQADKQTLETSNTRSTTNSEASVGEEEEDPGKLFHAWLLDGLRKDKFEINCVNARIHRVDEGVLLVSPGIFKDYDKEDWQRVQRRFQKLKLHRKTQQGTNIYTYQVTGKRNKSRIKGFLIDEPETVFEEISLPSPNPHLTSTEEL